MRNTSKPLLLIMNFILVACLPITADNPSQKEMPSNDNVNSSIKWIERAHYAETLDDAFRSLAFAVPGFAGLYIADSQTLIVRLTADGRPEQAYQVLGKK